MLFAPGARGRPFGHEAATTQRESGQRTVMALSEEGTRGSQLRALSAVKRKSERFTGRP
jgi:hypothetical protein